MHIFNQCLSPLTLWVWTPLRRRVLDATLCDKVCHWLVTGRWFSLGHLVSSINKTDCHNIAEILLKVALNIITLTLMHIFNNGICCTTVVSLLLQWSCLPSSAMKKWPDKRDILSLFIWPLAWCMDLKVSHLPLLVLILNILLVM